MEKAPQPNLTSEQMTEQEASVENLEPLKEKAKEDFQKILDSILMARDFNILELGLKNSEKGYSIVVPGTRPGFMQEDPASMRSKISDLVTLNGVLPGRAESFDDAMIELSNKNAAPWEELKELLAKKKEERKERFGN